MKLERILTIPQLTKMNIATSCAILPIGEAIEHVLILFLHLPLQENCQIIRNQLELNSNILPFPLLQCGSHIFFMRHKRVHFVSLNQSTFPSHPKKKNTICPSNLKHQPYSGVERKPQASMKSLTRIKSANQKQFIFKMFIFKKTHLNLKPVIHQFMKLTS